MDSLTLNLIMIFSFIIGTGLIILEAFIPGFGIAGISGIILELVAVWSVWKQFGMPAALIALLAVMLLIGVMVFLSYRSAVNGRLSKTLVLSSTEAPAADAASLDQWIGCEGVASTALRPAGMVELDGRQLSASSSGDFISKGTPVLVTDVEGGHLVVRQKT